MTPNEKVPGKAGIPKKSESLYDGRSNTLASHFSLFERFDRQSNLARMDADVGGTVVKVNVTNRHFIAAKCFGKPA